MAWTHIGTDAYGVDTSGQGSWTLAAGTVGDLRVLTIMIIDTISVSSISGGGVTTWHRAGGANTSTAANGAFGTNATIQMWYGRITSAGTALTVNYSSSIGSDSVRLHRADYRDAGGIQEPPLLVGVNYTDNANSVTTITWPEVTAGDSTHGDQLAVGYAFTATSATNGSTSGYTYSQDSSGNEHVYNLTVAASSSQQPTATQTSGGGYSAQLCVFAAIGSITANAGHAAVTAAAQKPGPGITATGALVTAAAQQAGNGIGAYAGAAAVTAAAQSPGNILTQPAGWAAVTATAEGVLGQGGETPAHRRYTVPPETRTIVASESRSSTVAPENRTVTVIPQESE